MDITDKINIIKVSLLGVAPLFLKLAEWNALVVFFTGVASFVYIIYKILEADSKRRFYKRKRKDEFKDE
jgi:hypothetical protein